MSFAQQHLSIYNTLAAVHMTTLSEAIGRCMRISMVTIRMAHLFRDR